MDAIQKGLLVTVTGSLVSRSSQFLLNLPIVNIPIQGSTGHFSNEFNNLIQQQITNPRSLPSTNFLEHHASSIPTTLNKSFHQLLLNGSLPNQPPLHSHIYINPPQLHLTLIFFSSTYLNKTSSKKSKIGIIQFSIRVSTNSNYSKDYFDLENLERRRSTLLFNHFSSPSPLKRISKEKLGRGVRPPRRRWLQKQAITTNLIAGARQKKALEGGWLGSRGEYVPPSHGLPNK